MCTRMRTHTHTCAHTQSEAQKYFGERNHTYTQSEAQITHTHTQNEAQITHTHTHTHTHSEAQYYFGERNRCFPVLKSRK